MIALAKTLFKYFLRICAIMLASIFVLPVYLNWAAGNQERLGFGENFCERKSTVTPISQGEELARLVDGANLLIMDGVGHVPQIMAPEAFYTNLIKALELIQEANNEESER